MFFNLTSRPGLLRLLAGVLLSARLSAQIPQAPINIQSPNAASLGTYGDVPVSLFTGKPDISVNLHTLADGDIQIPIALNYDASGVKPDVHPGWTGLNFNLSTQYAITRVIKDAPDDSPLSMSSLEKRGFFYTANFINYPQWKDPSGLKTITDNNIFDDREPDEFSFSIPGLTGKFYYGHDGRSPATGL